ncbi:MAG TPA: WHG domain-containing protein [Ensifer sp.]|nr:WHG domain-containing protein [Ensifer sp.]
MSKTTDRARDTYHVGNLAPQLISAARSMLEEVGPVKLSLRAVAERVGVSPTAAYHHYANRAELIGHLAAQGFDELAVALAARDRHGPGAETLRQSSLIYFRFARTNPALYQLMFGPEFFTGEMIPALQAARERAFGELRSTMAEVLTCPPDAPDVRRAARAAWSFTHGLASLVIHGVLQVPPNVPEDRFLESSLQGLEHLFAGKGVG